MEHIDRVVSLTTQFGHTLKLNELDMMVSQLAALLHDVDDSKLVGREKAARLENATRIMEHVGIASDTQVLVKGVIRTIGYSKALKGVRPNTVPGMIVSDADMNDALGASGIVRTLAYTLSSKGNGRVFDTAVWPNVHIGADEYNSQGDTTHETDGFINHHFEKLLKLRGMMLTEPGRAEAEARDGIMVEFLRHYFKEQDANEWLIYLEEYLAQR